MSANNYILIKWKNNRYEINHRDADTNATLDEIGEVEDLESAVRKANEFILDLAGQGMPVEYGLTIVLKPEKKKRK